MRITILRRGHEPESGGVLNGSGGAPVRGSCQSSVISSRSADLGDERARIPGGWCSRGWARVYACFFACGSHELYALCSFINRDALLRIEVELSTRVGTVVSNEMGG